MPVFHYKAASDSGDVVQGEMEAADREAVISALRSQGHIPIRAEEITAAGDDAPWILRLTRRRPGRRDVEGFVTELALLLRAGVAPNRALDTLAGIADDAAFKAVLERLRAQIQRGAPLWAAMEAEGRLFPRFYRNLVRAGEAGDALDAALARLAEHARASRAWRDEMLAALLYPLALAVAGGISAGVVLATVMPGMAELFAEHHEPLPWFTRILLVAGLFIRHAWWALALLLAGIVLFMRWQYAWPHRRRPWDQRLLRLPLAGPLVSALEAERFTRTLAGLLDDGVALPEAVAIASQAAINQAVADGLQPLAERLQVGEGLARPLKDARVFPPLAGHLIQVGEESGNLQTMLLELARIYEAESRAALRRLRAVLEPAVVVLLTAVFGIILLSLITAVTSIG